jgi:antitoxin (DNA-binding transcriptional repressor) of toxin-antitoxin stability system
VILGDGLVGDVGCIRWPSSVRDGQAGGDDLAKQQATGEHADDKGSSAPLPPGIVTQDEWVSALEPPRGMPVGRLPADLPALPGGFQELPFHVMRSVGLKVLKNRLSEYVRVAAGGETILITDRDRVVAELGPPREGRSAVLEDAKLAQMVRDGLLRPPTLPGLGPPPRKPVMSHDELMEELRKSREDR